MKTKWQKGAYFLTICMIISSLLVGCALFRDPTGSWNKATDKVEAVQKAIDKNEDARTTAARNYVYATQVVLKDDPSTNRHHEVASDLNEKALVTLGPPSMADVVYLQAMVKNLLATNTAIIIRGEQQLAELDNTVIALQKANAKLQLNLEKAEQKVLDVGTTNAGFASKWTTLMKFFWWIVYAFVGAIIIKILAVLVPAPYNSFFGIIDYVIGGFIRFIFKLAPKAMETAKVVGTEYKVAMEHVVTSIEDAKTKIGAKNGKEQVSVGLAVSYTHLTLPTK
jgi:hypothetical protein